MTNADIKLRPAVNIPTDDSSTAGGDMDTGAEITGAGAGEWMPQLVAPQSGTLDTDAVTQTQLAYISNEHASDDWLLGGLYMANLLTIPGVAGVLKAQSTSASDDTDCKIVCYSKRSGVLGSPVDLRLNGTTLVSDALSHSLVYRLVLRDYNTGAIVTAVGDISIWVGSTLIGMIPNGMSYATSEYEFAPSASLGDLGTFADRLTPPGGLSWSRPNTAGTKVLAPSTLAASDFWGVYCRETLQPGMPSAGTMRRRLRPHGVDAA